jgi:hypothetical protein
MSGDMQKVNTLGGTLGVVDAALENAPLDLTQAGAEMVGKTLGFAGFVLQTAVSAIDAWDANANHEQGRISDSEFQSKIVKVGVDVAVGAGALISPEAAVVGAGYFIADQTRAFEGLGSLPETAYEMMVWQAWSGMSISNPMNH